MSIQSEHLLLGFALFCQAKVNLDFLKIPVFTLAGHLKQITP